MLNQLKNAFYLSQAYAEQQEQVTATYRTNVNPVFKGKTSFVVL